MEERWSDEFLDDKRQQTDPVADAVVATLVEDGDLIKFNALVQTLTTNDLPSSEAFPDVAREYFSQTRSLPDWADRAQIIQAERFFELYSPEAVLTLLCKSLPQCYAAVNATKVLHTTQLLEEQLYRRIVETAQFVLDTMAPGGLDPNNSEGRGIRTAQKVRLLHASIRHIISKREDPPWNAVEWGKPINQEDLAGTLLSFSYLILDGLKRLGIDLTREEEEAYLHGWNVVGHIMGVDYELLTWNMEEAAALWQRLDERQFGASESGRDLTKSLVQFMENTVPGTLFDGFPSAMIRHMIGGRIADMVGVPNNLSIQVEKAIIKGPLADILGRIDGAKDENDRMRKFIGHFNQRLLEGLLMTQKLGKGVRFRLPTSLQQNERWRAIVDPTPISIPVTPKVRGWQLVLTKKSSTPMLTQE